MVHNLSFYTLLFYTLSLNRNAAEWVDMPQFSDENKVYRISSIQRDPFYKFKRGNANNSQTFRPVKTTYAIDDETETEKINSTRESYSFSDQIADGTFSETNRISTSIDTEDKPSERYNTTAPTTKDTAFKTHRSPLSSSIKRETLSQDQDHYNHTCKQYDGIFQYLPIDILKNVHHTLQSQSVSFEGKLDFLETFEKTLMSEIESRLIASMTPNRSKRDADYHQHGYNDHDDHHSVGFPSLEGALMAISFLTFAVYLVRLVMLLFRNMNNQMTTTTTAATIFLGKRKRSVDFEDNTARILNNIDSFGLSLSLVK